MRRLLLVFCLLALPALAAAPPGSEPKIDVSAEVLLEFQAIEALTAKGSLVEATQRGQALLPKLKDTPAARALLLRNLASLYGLQKHYEHAAHLLQESLELRAPPKEEAAKMRLEIAQYYAAAENFTQAADALATWLDGAQDPKPEQYLMLVELRTRLKQYPEAIRALETLIARTPNARPEWYQMLLALHHEQHDFEGSLKDIENLLERDADNPLYWEQLTGLYQEAKQDAKVLAVRQLMYTRGLLNKPEDIVQLVQVLRYQGLSNRAADILQKEIDRGRVARTQQNLALLADAWTEARDLSKAAAALEQATAQADNPETLLRLGQLYSELRDWPKARLTLTRAVTRGGLKNPGAAWLLLGMAHYRLHDATQARAAFQRAQAIPAVSKTAGQWLAHIERETKTSH